MATVTPNSRQASMDRKSKTVFQLDNAFTAVKWPQISAQNQDTILALLCSLLSPIGQYRTNYITPSKGKRSRKRKRQEAKLGKEVDISGTDAVPPPPDISRFITVGLNSITRNLEALSRNSNPEKSSTELSKLDVSGDVLVEQQEEKSKLMDDDSKTPEISPTTANEVSFSAVFVTRSSQPSILHTHIPQLVTTASLAHPSFPTTRLVQLSKGSEERLCKVLSMPRVSFIGLLDGAPLSNPLVDLIRECVAPVEIPWMEESKRGKYLPVKINSVQTFAHVVKKG